MPIVFEEVTGEITPGREAATPEAHEPPSSSQQSEDATARAVRETLCLLREREQRLRVD
jgi:hypothetical protein